MSLFSRRPAVVCDVRVRQGGRNHDGGEWFHRGVVRLLSDGRTQFATLSYIEDGKPLRLPDAGRFTDQFAGSVLPVGSGRADLIQAITTGSHKIFEGWEVDTTS